MSHLVSLDDVPPVPINADAVGEAAQRVKEQWNEFNSLASGHERAWGALGSVYHTAQTQPLTDRALTVSHTAYRARNAGVKVAKALDGLATDLSSAQSEASTLAAEIVDLRRRVINHRMNADPREVDPDWGWGQSFENFDLRKRATKLADAIEDAVARCRQLLEDVEQAPRDLRGFTSRQTPFEQRVSLGAAQATFENTLLLGILGSLESLPDVESMLALLEDRPEWLSYLWDHPPHPLVIEQWWQGLAPGVAALLSEGASVVVGNLNGVPFSDRIAANRFTLAREVERIRALPADQRDQEQLAAFEEMLNGETQYRNSEGRWVSRTGSQLLVFDPTNQAIATYHGPIDPITGGIPDWVDNVAVSVPGTGSTVTSFADHRAADLYAAANAAEHRARTVVIQWSGGEWPQNIPAAMNSSYAEDLAPRLASFVNSMPVSKSADVTVMGHSYGGATVGLASTTGLHADRVLFVSSAGMGKGVSGTGDYLFNSGTDYYSMMVRNDAVVGAIQAPESNLRSIHGQTALDTPGVTRLETGRIDASDPSSPTLERYQAPGNSKPAAFQSHSSLYTPGSTAFNNMVAVITGSEAQAFMPDQTVITSTGGFYTRFGNERDDLAPQMLEID